jgi:hypothetical protein
MPVFPAMPLCFPDVWERCGKAQARSKFLFNRLRYNEGGWSCGAIGRRDLARKLCASIKEGPAWIF